MQGCVLPAFVNNDIEKGSAVLRAVEAHVTLWMLQRLAQWAEDEKGDWRKGNKKGH